MYHVITYWAGNFGFLSLDLWIVIDQSKHGFPIFKNHLLRGEFRTWQYLLKITHTHDLLGVWQFILQPWDPKHAGVPRSSQLLFDTILFFQSFHDFFSFFRDGINHSCFAQYYVLKCIDFIWKTLEIRFEILLPCLVKTLKDSISYIAEG